MWASVESRGSTNSAPDKLSIATFCVYNPAIMKSVALPRPTNLGVAQMGERVSRAHEVAGSSPVTQTNSNSWRSTTSSSY